MGGFAMTDLYDAIAKALGQVSTGDGWVSQRELCAASGRSRSVVQDWIRDQFAAGRLEVGQARRVKITGQSQIVPVYRLKGGHDATQD